LDVHADAEQVRLPAAAHTRRLGETLGAFLQPGDCIALFGPIGAGKTTLVQGLAVGVGSERRATSPSFVLVHQYQGRPTLLHADLYRLQDGVEFEDLGLAEMAESEGAALAIEWCERCVEALPADRLEIHLTHTPTGRDGELRGVGCRGARLLRQAVASDCLGELWVH